MDQTFPAFGFNKIKQITSDMLTSGLVCKKSLLLPGLLTVCKTINYMYS
jgi:hypothetical protein